MRTFYKRALLGTLIAGGITLLGATVANAAETPSDPNLLTSIVADNGPVDALVGDGIVDPLLATTAPSRRSPTPWPQWSTA